MIVKVRGTFKEFDAGIHTTDKDFTSAGIYFWLNSVICIEEIVRKTLRRKLSLSRILENVTVVLVRLTIQAGKFRIQQ